MLAPAAVSLVTGGDDGKYNPFKDIHFENFQWILSHLNDVNDVQGIVNCQLFTHSRIWQVRKTP
jgi:hypothetical protein